MDCVDRPHTNKSPKLSGHSLACCVCTKDMAHNAHSDLWRPQGRVGILSCDSTLERKRHPTIPRSVASNSSRVGHRFHFCPPVNDQSRPTFISAGIVSSTPQYDTDCAIDTRKNDAMSHASSGGVEMSRES